MASVGDALVEKSGEAFLYVEILITLEEIRSAFRKK